MDNTHRFSGNQEVSDITLLLWKLGSLCIDQMETLLYGTDYKHGYLFSPPINKEMYEEQRTYLIDLMMDVAPELGITQEEIAASWTRVEQERKEGHVWGKEWIEKYGE